jgi:hypothetical protein
MSPQKIGISSGAQPCPSNTNLKPQNSKSIQRQYRKQKMATKKQTFIPDSKLKIIMTEQAYICSP